MATRELKTRITADNRDLKRGIADSNKQIGGFESGVKKAGIALAGVFAAGAVLNGIKNMVKEITNAADRLSDLSDMTGMSTAKLQEYQYVAKIAGVNTETVSNAALGLTRRLAGAVTEASPLNIALKELGIESRTATGELRNIDTVMDEVITSLANFDNQTERNVKGAQIFGGAWRDMAPILSKGGDELAKLRKEAYDLGIIMDEQSIKKANEFRESMVKLNEVGTSLGRELALSLVPVLEVLAQSTLKVVLHFRELFDMGDQKMQATAQVQDLTKALLEMDETARASYLSSYVDETSEQLFSLGQQAKKLSTDVRRFLPEFTAGYKDWKKEIDGVTSASDRLVKVLVDIGLNQSQYIEGIQQNSQAAIDAIEAEAAAARAAEAERIAALGEIGKLKEDLARAEAGFIAANSDANRAKYITDISNIKELIELLEGKASKLAADIKILEGGMSGVSEISPITPTSGTPILQTKQEKELNDTYQSQAGILGGLTEKLNELNSARLAAKTPEEIESINKQIASVEELRSKLGELGTAYNELGAIAEQMAFDVGGAFMKMAQDGGKNANQIIMQAMSVAIAQIMKWVATTIPFPANIPAMIAAGAAGQAAFSGIQKFADGGIVSGPTMGIMGEYANARSNPEVIAPLDKLKDMMGGMEGNVTFEIKGDRLFGMLKREENRRTYN